jgi:hypothetical protein
MIGYGALAWYEGRISTLEPWYRALRVRLTLGVVVAHLVFIALHVTGA